MSAEPRFCERCQVAMDLHPFPDDENDPGCAVADRKADLVDAFWTMRGGNCD